MNPKALAIAVVVASLFGSTAFSQTINVSGRVTALTGSQITVQSGTNSWTIQRTATTTVTSGNLSVGQMVTIQCAAPDAQKKEEPAIQPTPTPAGQ
jgi:hypothetical protein